MFMSFFSHPFVELKTRRITVQGQAWSPSTKLAFCMVSCRLRWHLESLESDLETWIETTSSYFKSHRSGPPRELSRTSTLNGVHHPAPHDHIPITSISLRGDCDACRSNSEVEFPLGDSYIRYVRPPYNTAQLVNMSFHHGL